MTETPRSANELELVATGYSIVEGPCYDPQKDRLIFADGYGGVVYALTADRRIEIVIPKRHCSGIALHERGGLVVSGRNVGWKRDEQSARLLELDANWGMAYFNDLGTDIAGRVYVGSVDYDPANSTRDRREGFLHVIDLDGSSRIVADDISIANGIAVSPDGAILYFSDTGHHCIWRFRTLPDGDLARRDKLIAFDHEAAGAPDGIAVAADGSVWIALAGASCVVVVEADGRERRRIPIPQAGVASLSFGSPNLRELYVTTIGGLNEPATGSIYRLPVDVPGMPVPLARVALPTER